MALKNEVDVVGKLDALPIGHGEQPVVIQHTVERLNPPAWVVFVPQQAYA